MSYSFTARGATKAEVIEKVSAELDKVVASQPIHSADRQQAQAAAEAFLGVIPAPADGKEYYLSVGGSVGWNGNLGTPECILTSASVNVSASIVAVGK